jgi:hypothetical protein
MSLSRRSFLSLLIATPLVPALAKLPRVLVEPTLTLPEAELVRRYVLTFSADAGFDLLVGAGRIARLVAMPQIPFLPDRLLCADDGRDFEILGVSALGEPQLDQVLPAALFSAMSGSRGRGMFDAVPPGGQIVMAVRNTSDEPRRFAAALIGNGIG